MCIRDRGWSARIETGGTTCRFCLRIGDGDGCILSRGARCTVGNGRTYQFNGSTVELSTFLNGGDTWLHIGLATPESIT